MLFLGFNFSLQRHAHSKRTMPLLSLDSFKLFLCSVLLFSKALYAQETTFLKEPFSKAKFESYQQAGVPVLIDVYASWCPTCERQQWILDAYFKENPENPVKVLVVDYDKNKEAVEYFKAPRQSTLAIFHNGERKWFSVAETRKRFIVEALDAYQSSSKETVDL